MSIESVREYLSRFGADSRILELAESSATVELAAAALRTEPRRIAKTLAFLLPSGPVVISVAGDAKVDNGKYRAFFGAKAKMLSPEECVSLLGHAPGGVCPFALKDGVRVCLDESLRRFDTVYPACGSSNSAIGLTIEELERFAAPECWVDVCKGWREEPDGQ